MSAKVAVQAAIPAIVWQCITHQMCEAMSTDFDGCAAGAVIRLAMDQLLWAPIFISTFLASLLTLEVCLLPLNT